MFCYIQQKLAVLLKKHQLHVCGYINIIMYTNIVIIIVIVFICSLSYMIIHLQSTYRRQDIEELIFGCYWQRTLY